MEVKLAREWLDRRASKYEKIPTKEYNVKVVKSEHVGKRSVEIKSSKAKEIKGNNIPVSSLAAEWNANLSPIEEAKIFLRLRFAKYTAKMIAEVCGKTTRYVEIRMRLLKLPESVRAAVHEGKLPVSRAFKKVEEDQTA